MNRIWPLRVQEGARLHQAEFGSDGSFGVGRRLQEQEIRRKKSLLRLLLPAFEAGVEASLASHRSDFESALDSIAEGVLIVDPLGRVSYENRALISMAKEAGDLELRQEVLRAATTGASLLRNPRKRESERGWELLSREIGSGRRRYRITVRLSTRVSPTREPIAVAVVERCELKRPSAESLCARFRLTRREAEIALLLAERKSHKEVAAALGISVHTARHHSERVRMKLGVHSRAEVERLIFGAASSN